MLCCTLHLRLHTRRASPASARAIRAGLVSDTLRRCLALPGSRLSHLFAAHQVTADLIQLGKIRLRIGQKANEPAARGQTNCLPQFRFPAIVLPGPDRDGRSGDEALAFFDIFLASPRLGEHFVGDCSRFLPLPEFLVRKHSTLVNQKLISNFRVSISRRKRLVKVRKRVARVISQYQRGANCSEIADLATDITRHCCGKQRSAHHLACARQVALQVVAESDFAAGAVYPSFVPKFSRKIPRSEERR